MSYSQRFAHAQLNAPTIAAGATLCPAPNTDAADAKGGSPDSPAEPRSTTAPPTLPPDGRPNIGRPTPCSSYRRPGHPRRPRALTIAVRQPSLRPVLSFAEGADPVAATLTRLRRSLPTTLRQSTIFDNGTATSASHASSAYRSTSATRTHPGTRAASKTPSADCAETSRAKPTSPPCPANASTPSPHTSQNLHPVALRM
jgi:hypothetical protein